MSPKTVILVVLQLATAAALAYHAPSVAEGNRLLISARSYGTPLAAGFFQSTLGQPDFSLSATPSFQSATPGNSASYGVTVTLTNATTGFYGNVALSVEGLPPGGTSRFSPNSIRGSGSSTLSILTPSSTPVGNYTATITAVAGSIIHVTQVTLAVSDFSISIAPTSRNVLRGATTSYTVSIKPLGSFMATIRFNLTGLPSGARSSFKPASISNSGTTTLTISSRQSAPVATYSLSIRGVGVGIAHSAVAILTVQ